jgi:hypothetical protein
MCKCKGPFASLLILSSLVPIFAGLMLAGCATSQTQKANATDPANEPVAFYSVPLICPAAPDIGCGSRAKPILHQLEASTDIRQAWLNRAGTQLAVVWEDPGSPRSRSRTLNTLLRDYDIVATDIPREEQGRAAADFNAQVNWYRAEGLDQLSGEEAGVIAARILRRFQAKTPLSDEKAATLRAAMTNTLRERFLSLSEQPARSPTEEREVFLQKVAPSLSETELAALRESIIPGFRPLPGEE